MKPTKAHRKRHSPSTRTYVSFTADDTAALADLKGRFREALGYDLSVPLIISMALRELTQRLRDNGQVPHHPDARVTH